MRKFRKSPFFLYALAIIILGVIIYVVPNVTGALTASYTVENERLQVYDEITGTIVRKETVYSAGHGGDANRYIGGGSLVRKNTRIMEVTGHQDEKARSDRDMQSLMDALKGSMDATTTYRTDSEGVVSYYADGYEKDLTPETMNGKDESYYKSLEKESPIDLKRDQVLKGEPVFKLVDRAEWYLVCFVPEDHAGRYKKGSRIRFSVEGNSPIYGTITEKKSEGRDTRLVIQTNYYYKNFADRRTADVKLITADAAGPVIYNSSITEKKGQKGVYVKSKTGKYEFTPISVITSDGEKSVIARGTFVDAKGNIVNTVKDYDEVKRRG